ncbi:hypothetical protein [Mesorhizobium sp.]|uniref:hypothetical protein n=1 Tax=Mesorhizobium sp. TaxID=1871066 RepID=UPI000FE8A657|nr:hypothetical protein [Mesorhizobium sp.]RWC52858.1 MAG: hypothetical protein EOS56_31550 [Mesorhizobium sp.]RWC53007.1 MAG: hypothetical protein EOS29_30280 [Mesorhizobium sp.]
MDQPITLYLDLKKDTKADLAVVARAALAFDAAVKEIAYVLDPSITIRVEFDNSTEGSLKLHSILKKVKGLATDKATLRAVALVVIGWIASDVRSYLTQSAIETIVREEMNNSDHLSDEDIKRIAEEVAKALNGHVGEKQVRKVYEELERDESIDGVGVTTNPDKKPRIIVPRREFKQRSGSVVEQVPGTEARAPRTYETVTLISPVLLDTDRRWKFSLYGFEFGAKIKDHEFLDRLLSGQETVPMVAGITMDVELETKEEKIGGVWVIKERSIERVLQTHPVGRQTRLSFNKADDDQHQ